MRSSILAILFLLAIAVLTANAHGQPAWLAKMKQIRLLSASYEEVIRVLGMPVDGTTEREYSEYFDLHKGRVWVGFSSSNCGEVGNNAEEYSGWDVPAYTATSVSFRPHRPISPRRLKFSLEGFQKMPIKDVPGAWIYRNDVLGIEYSTTSTGKIEELELYPSNQLIRTQLQCKRPAPSSSEEYTLSGSVFD